ncbi:MAG: ABC transporter ATP-binding protein [Sporolactobacillus sp.]|nr:ABC transporter ATP-binding protein [Sporolactobacillus sp.]
MDNDKRTKRGRQMSFVVVQNLYKSYDDSAGNKQYVLNNVNFQVEKNEFICVIGHSGCGKSTLLNLLAGFIKPDRGEIFLNGKTVTGPSVQQGVVFQNHALFPWYNVIDNVAFGPKIAKNKNAYQVAERLIKMVGLEGYEKKYPNSLSGGMAQRVGIARALASDPALLLMDEPLGALDAMTRQKMRLELLRIWRQTQKTVIFITHSITEAVYLADRVLVLQGGKICLNQKIAMARPRETDSQLFLSYTHQLETILLDANQLSVTSK